MTILPTSSSDPEARPSASFARLHPRMQRWVYDEGWTTLHDAQERAIGPILDGDRDVIISAATAAGKTEAAFLPICSALASAVDTGAAAPPPDPWVAHDPWTEPAEPAPTGVEVLYLSPLKALINDQYDRLELLCERAGVPVHRWHGDVTGSAKAKILKAPAGVLLITPESLEATFVNRGSHVARLFCGLRYVVVDELHSFLGEPRGAQLQSLLGRVELTIRHRPPRVGLSATLGDMSAAARFLRPTDPDRVLVISSAAAGQEMKLQVRGYRATAPRLSAKEADDLDATGVEVDIDDTLGGDKVAIADHLFRVLRGTDNLVFANSRRDVELFADMLARRSEQGHLPNEFWPHHGSLAKDVREVVEAQIKDRTRPVTAVCTSTLEMGIDIGSVSSVAQIGPPPSVAALRQRLGRSGRRDEAAVLRVYVAEPELDVRSSPLDQLRTDLVQSIAMVRRLLERWVEPPDDPGLNLSTLIQQTLSLIAQHSGVTADDAHRALCGPGPFEQVDGRGYARLLRAMASADLIIQAGDKTLLHGPTGERAVNHYSFYAAFQTAEEWRLVGDGRTLGSLPITQPLIIGGLLIFAGRRWRITDVDPTAKVVELTRAAGGIPPNFGGGGALVSDRVRTEMVAVYTGTDVPVYLDRTARELLADARDAWNRLGLADTTVVSWGTDTFVLPWVGDATLGTLAVALGLAGVEADIEDAGLVLPGTSSDGALDAFSALHAQDPPDAVDLARRVENREIDKWDWVLDDNLSATAYAARHLDVPGAWDVVARVAATHPRPAPADPKPPPLGPPASREEEPPSQPRPARRVARTGSGEEFCVIDVETTGFSPRLGDRVVEIAAVRMREDGTVIDEWATLVNPSRDIGATHIHGITASDVVGAPEFTDVAGDLLERLDGAVLAAHNLRFDRGFLSAEYQSAGHPLPDLPGLCTLALGHRLQPGLASRKLAACCADLGIDLTRAHEALDDARAAAQLLAVYLDLARAGGLTGLKALGCQPLTWPEKLPALEPSGRRHPRGGRAHLDAQAGYLAHLVERLDGYDAGDPDLAAYLDVLDRALEDRRITAAEADALAGTAAEWGLSRTTVLAANRRYLDALADAAIADGIITDHERADLELVAQLLGFPSGDLDATLDAATRRAGTATTASKDLTGLTVCFTGALAATVDGAPLTRAVAEHLAAGAGLRVAKNVTKDLDLLVVADPDTQSAKARRARELGTRIIAERVFWQSLGLDVG